MRKLTMVLIATGAVLLSAPSFARAPQATSLAPSAAGDSQTSLPRPKTETVTVTANNTSALDEVMCKNEPPPSGTRIGGARVCKTNREWRDQEDAMNRQRVLRNNTDFAAGSGIGGTCACSSGR